MAVMKGIFSAETAEDALAAVNDLTSTFSISDMFIGRIGGSLGETSALALLLGFVYLLLRRVINWQIPVCYIGTVAVLTLISAPAGMSAVDFMLYNVFGGGLMLGAIFMATDYATSPVTKLGQAIFGVGCGLITCFIRRFGSYPEGVCYSILIMNCTTWLLDKYIRPTIYGAIKKDKKGGGPKMKISGKFILKVAGTLTIISLVVALLLGLVNGVTADKIAAMNAAATQTALEAVTEAGSTYDEITSIPQEVMDAAKEMGGTLEEMYTVTFDGQPAGYAVKLTASGSQGLIEMVIGVDAEQKITGISVVSHSETSGIGTKVCGNMPNDDGVPVLDQFVGMSGAGTLKVGKTVTAISGATVSTKGVTKGANAALAAVAALG